MAFKIVEASHLDHGLTEAQIDFIKKTFADRKGFFLETVELPEELGTVPSALYGPIAGDEPVPEAEVHYAKRGDRKYESRLIKAPTRPTRSITVIAGEHEGEPCVLYTAFGGQRTPKEPGDDTLTPENRDFATKFWAEHALATG